LDATQAKFWKLGLLVFTCHDFLGNRKR